MVHEFNKETGIVVSMTRKGSGETFAQIWAERKNPKGDVWWGGTGDAHIQAAEVDLTETYQSPFLAHLHPWAIDPEGQGRYRMTGIYLGLLGFGYNREWLEKNKLPPPRAWNDLISPQYHGEVQMANPNSSGSAYTMLATIVQLYGEVAAFDYFRQLHKNINQYTKSGVGPIKAAARGETGIGIAFMHDAFTERDAGFPMEVVYPSDGTGYEIGGVSIIRGARHVENARQWIDWALTAEAQGLAAAAKSFQTPSNKNALRPKDAPDPAHAKLINFDIKKYGSKSMRQYLLKRWHDTVKNQVINAHNNEP